MKISKAYLRQIIAEEIEATTADLNRKKRTKKRRKNDDPPSVKKRKQPWEVFPGYDDRNGGLKQLANGIMEDDEGCEGNPFRKSDGTWGSSDNATVYTRGYKGDNKQSGKCVGKFKASGGGKGAAAAKPCGRRPDGRKYPYRCRDGKRLWEDEETGDVYVHLDDVIAVLQQLSDVAPGHQQTKVIEGRQELAQKCRQMGFTTPQEAFKNLAATLNTLKRAEAGKLYEPQKG